MALTLSALHIYPVKGLKGIELESAACTDRGLEHDRRWMVVDGNGDFLSQREVPKMATIWTDIAGGSLVLSAPDLPSVDVPLDAKPAQPFKVRVWKSVCDAIPVSAEADVWLSGYLGRSCRLVHMPDSTKRFSPTEHSGGEKLVGFADAFAYLVTTEASLADLNSRLAARAQRPVPMNRFRPNLVVSGSGSFAEDGWREIRVGEAVLRAARRCGRCQVTTTDQSTGEVTGPEPLATLSTFHADPESGPCFGVNFVTVTAGGVSLGDTVEVVR
jgi:uncharacterized protein